MRRLFIALAVLVMLVVGCTPNDGTPSPSPSSSAVVSSSPSPTPTPSVSSSEDALYAEAEQVYVAALEAQWKYQLTGDYSEFPPELAKYFSADYLEAVRVAFEEGKQVGGHLVGGRPVVTIGKSPAPAKNGSEVALPVCLDSRSLTAIDGSGADLGVGALIQGVVYLKHIDGDLRIFDMHLEEVAKCSVE